MSEVEKKLTMALENAREIHKASGDLLIRSYALNVCCLVGLALDEIRKSTQNTPRDITPIAADMDDANAQEFEQ